MSRLKIVVALILGLFLLGTTLEVGEEGKGFYVGLGYGDVTFDDDGFGNNFLLASGPSETKSKGKKFYGGYQFTKIIALEFSYTDFGTFHSISDQNDFLLSPEEKSIYANFGYSFWDAQLRPFVNLGGGQIVFNYKNEPTEVLELDDTGVYVKYGLGFEYVPTDLYGLGLRVAYERYHFYETIYTDGLNTGNYNQRLTLLYLAIMYKYEL